MKFYNSLAAFRLWFFFFFLGMGFLIPRLSSYVLNTLSFADPGFVFLAGLLIYPFGGLALGVLSDKTLWVRKIQLAGSLVAAACLILFSLPEVAGRDIRVASLLWAGATFALGGVIPLANVSFLQSGHPEQQYSGVRLYGTLGFLTANIFLLFFRLDDGLLIRASGVLMAISTIFLFAIPANRKVTEASQPFHVSLIPKYLRSPEFLFFALVLFLFFVAFAPAEHVIGAQLKKIPFMWDSVSLAWILATSVEACFFLIASKENSHKPETYLLIGLSAGIIRWLLMTFLPQGVPFIWIQALHGLQFGPGYLGFVLYVKQRSNPHNLASAQALSMILGRAFGTGSASFIFGNMAAMGNFTGVYAFAAFAGGLGLFLLLFIEPKIPRKSTFLK